jgi:hypothetical protein
MLFVTVTGHCVEKSVMLVACLYNFFISLGKLMTCNKLLLQYQEYTVYHWLGFLDVLPIETTTKQKLIW